MLGVKMFQGMRLRRRGLLRRGFGMLGLVGFRGSVFFGRGLGFGHLGLLVSV